MDSRRGQGSRAATGHRAVAKKAAAKQPARKVPAKKAATKAGQPTARAVPATPGPTWSIADMLAKLPAAGADVDPTAKGPRSFHISRQVLERARAAVYWLAQSPDITEPTTVSDLADQALRREVERLERTYNQGKPFPAVQGRMKTGPGAEGITRLTDYQSRRRASRRGTDDDDHGGG